MIRYASAGDFNFINSLVLSEAQKGHFDRRLLIPGATQGWMQELQSILRTGTRLNGLQAYSLIWEKNNNPTGFIIMSAGPDNKGNELWMAAVLPAQRGIGEGKRMVLEILKQFKGNNLSLIARCAPESSAMFHILTANGFKHIATGERGYRALLYTQ